jgi:hypothetical protein
MFYCGQAALAPLESKLSPAGKVQPPWFVVKRVSDMLLKFGTPCAKQLD